MKKQGMIRLVIMVLMISFVSVGIQISYAQESTDEAPQVPAGIKIYEGEITDEMIQSFLRADAKIRALRQQIAQITQQILTEENVQAEVYMAIAQKMRQGPDFLERVRTTAAAMVAADATPDEGADA
ncbi:hypothetical protein ACFL3D_03420 [Candidatus Omnitrophota bacterium]